MESHTVSARGLRRLLVVLPLVAAALPSEGCSHQCGRPPGEVVIDVPEVISPVQRMRIIESVHQYIREKLPGRSGLLAVSPYVVDGGDGSYRAHFHDPSLPESSRDGGTVFFVDKRTMRVVTYSGLRP